MASQTTVKEYLLFMAKIEISEPAEMIDVCCNYLLPVSAMAKADFDVTQLMKIPWAGKKGEAVYMTEGAAKHFVHALRMEMTRKELIMPEEGKRGREEVSSAAVLQKQQQENMEALRLGLRTLFPWDEKDPHLGITLDKQVRKDLCDETDWQDGLMFTYEKSRRAAWDALPPTLQRLLQDEKPFSLRDCPPFLARAAVEAFNKAFDDLMVLWLQAFIFKTTRLWVPDPESIKETIRTRQYRMRRWRSQKTNGDVTQGGKTKRAKT